MQYGLSGELLSLNCETRTYNSRLQLTRITGGANMEYRYSPTQNNGQITQQKDWNTGEEVTYTYDSLQRLIGAVTTDSSWGQSFTYDGFGNQTSASVTKGSAHTETGATMRTQTGWYRQRLRCQWKHDFDAKA